MGKWGDQAQLTATRGLLFSPSLASTLSHTSFILHVFGCLHVQGCRRRNTGLGFIGCDQTGRMHCPSCRVGLSL